MPACDLKIDDRVYAFVDGKVLVGTIDRHSEQGVDTPCFQLEFEDPASTVWIAMDGQPENMFVELYGELAPHNPGDFVKHLRFRHHDNFALLCQSRQLQSCIQKMNEGGYQPDLTQYGLGPGKMFVTKTLAKHVVQTLKDQGRKTTCRDVFVSKSYERTVLEAVQNDLGGRRNWTIGDMRLDLGRSNLLWLDSHELKLTRDPSFADKTMVTVERTFVDIHSPVEDAPSTKTQSTSDRYKTSGDAFSAMNPRGPPLVGRRGQH